MASCQQSDSKLPLPESGKTCLALPLVHLERWNNFGAREAFAVDHASDSSASEERAYGALPSRQPSSGGDSARSKNGALRKKRKGKKKGKKKKKERQKDRKVE